MQRPFSLDEVINRRDVPALKVHPKVLGVGADKLFAAGVADMDFKTAPVVMDALQERLDHGVFGYEAVPDGLMPALIQWLRDRHDWQVDENHILRAPNILNALATAVNLFTEEGDGVIVQPPVFFDFFDVLRENNRCVVSNPLIHSDDGYHMDYEDLERKASHPRTKMMFLCNPHNPVGRVWTEHELKTLGEICARYGVLVVSDEIHADIVFKGHKHTPFASLGSDNASNCMTCLSPAKSFNLASCCNAFIVISDDQKRKAFQVENSRLTVNKNNAFASVAMEAAYRGGASWLDQVLKYLEMNVALVSEHVGDIANVDLVKPQGTFLLWFDFRKLDLTPDELMTFLREQAKWSVTRGHAFGDEGAGFARVNIACQRSKLEAALKRLSSAIRLLSG